MRRTAMRRSGLVMLRRPTARNSPDIDSLASETASTNSRVLRRNTRTGVANLAFLSLDCPYCHSLALDDVLGLSSVRHRRRAA